MPFLHPLLWLLFAVCALGILYWAFGQAPIPPPFRWIVNVVFALIALFVLFEFVAPLIGGSAPTHSQRL